jgi:hypothetical protein
LGKHHPYFYLLHSALADTATQRPCLQRKTSPKQERRRSGVREGSSKGCHSKSWGLGAGAEHSLVPQAQSAPTFNPRLLPRSRKDTLIDSKCLLSVSARTLPACCLSSRVKVINLTLTRESLHHCKLTTCHAFPS